jgi:hypothetical protein
MTVKPSGSLLTPSFDERASGELGNRSNFLCFGASSGRLARHSDPEINVGTLETEGGGELAAEDVPMLRVVVVLLSFFLEGFGLVRHASAEMSENSPIWAWDTLRALCIAIMSSRRGVTCHGLSAFGRERRCVLEPYVWRG